MIILKIIFRFAVAGLLVCGLCASSAQPSLAAAVKDTKQAAKNGRDYVNKLYFEMADAMNEAYKCAGNKLPRDIEKYYWHPSALLLCKPQQEAADQKFKQLQSLDLDDPSFLWGNKDEQERVKRELAASLDFLSDLMYVQRFFIKMFDSDQKYLVESIFKVHKMGYWLQEKSEDYKKKMTAMNGHLQKFKERGDVEELKKLGNYVKYANGKMTPVNQGVFLYDVDRHTAVLKKDGQRILDALGKFGERIAQLKEKTMTLTMTKLKALKGARCYDRMTRAYNSYMEDLIPRLEITINYLCEKMWGPYVWAENEEGKFLTTKGVSSFAPLLEPVSSYSYIEAWQNACQYYIPNSMDVQIKRMSLD